MSDPDTRSPPPTGPMAKACPICGAPQDVARRPFCSKRCANVDLGYWFKESYAIPALEAPDDFDGGDGLDESER